MGQSKAQTKATNNYRKSHYEQFNLQLPIGTKTKLIDYAKANNFQSLTALICYLLEKETGISCKLENGLAWIKK